jgi:hypothetical protein
MTAKLTLTGRRFGRLVVIKEAGRCKYGQVLWECRCDCGKTTIVLGNSLQRRLTKSCGCLHSELNRKRLTTHGMSRERQYKNWAGMIQRCRDQRHRYYKNYGGRGITVCDRWLNFENFFEDMGPQPDGMTIEREDNNKGYEPGNCKWATRAIQNRNKQGNVYLEHNGMRLLQQDWAKILRISRSAIRYHLKRGKTFEEIIERFS